MSAKYFAALSQCLRDFIQEGQTWEQVERWMDRLKKHSLKKSLKSDQERQLAFASATVPSRKSTIKQIYDHLNCK